MACAVTGTSKSARDVIAGGQQLFGRPRREVQGAPFGGEGVGRREADTTDTTGASGYEGGTVLQPEVHAPPV